MMKKRNLSQIKVIIFILLASVLCIDNNNSKILDVCFIEYESTILLKIGKI